MSKFRKKPVVIEAYQVPHPDPGYERCEVPTWMMQAIIDRVVVMDPNGGAVIHTLEGDMRADPHDWIIQGVKGELYPCKPDIFEATYEPASSRPAAVSPQPEEKPPLPTLVKTACETDGTRRDIAATVYVKEGAHVQLMPLASQPEGWQPIVIALQQLRRLAMQRYTSWPVEPLYRCTLCNVTLKRDNQPHPDYCDIAKAEAALLILKRPLPPAPTDAPGAQKE